MKASVEPFISVTGWTISSSSTVAVNEFKEFIAGLQVKSLLFFFDSAGGRTASKTVSVDVSDYTELVFSLFSFRKNAETFWHIADYQYKLILNGTKEYLIPTWTSFVDVTIYIGDVSAITSIAIEAIHADDDYLIMSEMVAVKEELPLDILTAIKEQLESLVATDIGDGVNVGTVSGDTGDSVIIPSGSLNWIERYSVITIDDGVNSETHQIGENDGSIFNFTSLYDGAELLNDYADADLLLQYPVEFGKSEGEIILPGIVVWEMSPSLITRESKLEIIYDTLDAINDTWQARQAGQNEEYGVLIDCEARQYEQLAELTKLVRRLLAPEKLWISGRKHDMRFEETSIEVSPTEGIKHIPKVQYTLIVEVKEDIHARETLVNTTTIDITSNIGSP